MDETGSNYRTELEGAGYMVKRYLELRSLE